MKLLFIYNPMWFLPTPFYKDIHLNFYLIYLLLHLITAKYLFIS